MVFCVCVIVVVLLLMLFSMLVSELAQSCSPTPCLIAENGDHIQFLFRQIDVAHIFFGKLNGRACREKITELEKIGIILSLDKPKKNPHKNEHCFNEFFPHPILLVSVNEHFVLGTGRYDL